MRPFPSRKTSPWGTNLSISHRNIAASPKKGTPSASGPPQKPVFVATHDATGIGHNGDPALSDADLIREVLARGLQSAVAARPSDRVGEQTARLGEPTIRPLGPLAISVKTARESIGVGNTSMWALIKSGDVDVVRIGRRTLVVVASLAALIASRTASARQSGQAQPENVVNDNAASPSRGRSARGNTK
jgi:hypothetical protein